MIAWAALAGMLVASAPRVNLYVSEDVDPDLLAALARPESVLWLRTKSNALRKSIRERLARFQAAYVQLRLPISADQAEQFGPSMRVGAWVSGEERFSDLVQLGPRALAVDLTGKLTEAQFERLQKLQPTVIAWKPAGAGPNLDEWGRLFQLPGLQWVDAQAARPDMASCQWVDLANPKPFAIACGVRPDGEEFSERVERPRRHSAALRIDLTRADAPVLEGWAHRCGLSSVVHVPISATESDLSAVYARDPSAELEVEVPDDMAASAARQLLDRVEAAGSALK